MLSLLLQLRPPARLSMGCGPSNIINPRKWRSRARSNNSGSDAGSDEDADDAAPVPRRGVATDADHENAALLAVAAAAASGGGAGTSGGGGGGGAAAPGETDDETSRAAAARLRQLAQNAPGPQLPHTYSPHIEVSASQTDFFRILDMKVESGPELDPDSKAELLREEDRLRVLQREWDRCRQQRVQRDQRDQHDCRDVQRASRHYHDVASRAGARAKPEHAVLSHGAALASSTSSVRNAGGSPRHPQHPSQYPSSTATTTTSHDAAWRRTNLAWVPEQRPVGVAPGAPGAAVPLGAAQSLYGQPYPGRAVSAWAHNSYQGYDTVGTWYTASPAASSTASATSVGFRPYRQQSDAGQPGPWAEVGSGTARVDYDEAMLYHGQGLGPGPGSGPGPDQGLGHDHYYSQQPYAYQGLGQRYGLGGGAVLGGSIASARHPDQHLANSMVQLDKSGSTRTELA